MRKIILFLVCCLISSVILPVTSYAKTEELSYFVDDCSSLGKYFEQNGSFGVNRDYYYLISDNSTIALNAIPEDSKAYLVYKIDGTIKNAEILFAEVNAPDNYFTFELSGDGKVWTEIPVCNNYYEDVAKGKSTDNKFYSNITTFSTWNKYLYKLENCTGAYSYLKVIFNNTGLLCNVKIGFEGNELSKTKDISYDPASRMMLSRSKTDEAYDMLLGLDLITDKSVSVAYNRVITRNEFAKDICKLCMIDGGDNPLDVLANSGFFAKSDNYYDESPLDLNCALKMVLHLLNFDVKAEAVGGYPNGYLKVAKELKLVDNVADRNAMTLGEELLLLKSVIEAPYITVSSMSKGMVSYSSEGTYLEAVRKIYCEDGIVTANAISGISSREDYCSDNSIKINDVLYKCGNSKNCFYMLGYNVTVYYSEQGGTREVAYITPNNRKNSIVEFSAKNLNENSTKTLISYDAGSSNKTLRVKSSADLIFNGVASTFTDDKLFIDKGYIRLIDNNNDGTYDIIFVDEYKSMKIDMIEADARTLICNGEQKVFLKDDAWESIIQVYSNERILDEYSLSIDNTISLCEGIGLGKRCYKIILSGLSVSGTVKSYDSDSIIIGSSSYDLSSQCISDIENSKLPRLEIGNSYNFYIDAFKEVIFYKDSNDDVRKYGYMLKLKQNSRDDDLVQAHVFTTDGKWVDYTLKEKLKINSVTVKADETISKIMSLNNDKVETPIRYCVNSDNKITKIELPTNLIGASVENTDKAINTDLFRCMGKTAEAGYNAETTTMLGWTFFIDDNTDIIVIPDAERRDREDLYGIQRKGNLNNWIYNATAYDADSFGQTKFMVFVSNMRTYEVYKTFREALKVSSVVNLSGDEVVHIEDTYSGSYDIDLDAKYYSLIGNEGVYPGSEGAYSPFTVNSIKKGDIFYTNSELLNGVVNDVVRGFSIDSWIANPRTYSVNIWLAENNLVSVFFSKLSSDKKIIQYKNALGDKTNVSIRTLQDVYLTTVEGNHVDIKKVDITECREDDYIVLRKGYNGFIQTIYIYRKER